MTVYGLTVREAQLLDFLKTYLEAHDHAPSFTDMMAAISLKSKSGIHRMLVALEARGHIHRLKYQARAIALGPSPLPKLCPHCSMPVAL